MPGYNARIRKQTNSSGVREFNPADQRPVSELYSSGFLNSFWPDEEVYTPTPQNKKIRKGNARNFMEHDNTCQWIQWAKEQPPQPVDPERTGARKPEDNNITLEQPAVKPKPMVEVRERTGSPVKETIGDCVEDKTGNGVPIGRKARKGPARVQMDHDNVCQWIQWSQEQLVEDKKGRKLEENRIYPESEQGGQTEQLTDEQTEGEKEEMGEEEKEQWYREQMNILKSQQSELLEKQQSLVDMMSRQAIGGQPGTGQGVSQGSESATSWRTCPEYRARDMDQSPHRLKLSPPRPLWKSPSTHSECGSSTGSHVSPMSRVSQVSQVSDVSPAHTRMSQTEDQDGMKNMLASETPWRTLPTSPVTTRPVLPNEENLPGEAWKEHNHHFPQRQPHAAATTSSMDHQREEQHFGYNRSLTSLDGDNFSCANDQKIVKRRLKGSSASLNAERMEGTVDQLLYNKRRSSTSLQHEERPERPEPTKVYDLEHQQDQPLYSQPRTVRRTDSRSKCSPNSGTDMSQILSGDAGGVPHWHRSTTSVRGSQSSRSPEKAHVSGSHVSTTSTAARPPSGDRRSASTHKMAVKQTSPRKRPPTPSGHRATPTGMRASPFSVDSTSMKVVMGGEDGPWRASPPPPLHCTVHRPDTDDVIDV